MIGWIIAFLTFVAIVIRAILSVTGAAQEEFDLDFACQLIDAPIFTIILILLLGASGTQLVVTVGLASGIGDLMKHSLLVKKMQVVESFAYCSELLTEKTGTLTKNKMEVVATYIEDEVRAVESGVTLRQELKEDWVALGKVEMQNGEVRAKEKTSVVEKGLASFFKNNDQHEIQRLFNERDIPGKVLFNVGFTSRRKRSTCAYTCNNGKTVRVVCLAASE